MAKKQSKKSTQVQQTNGRQESKPAKKVLNQKQIREAVKTYQAEGLKLFLNMEEKPVCVLPGEEDIWPLRHGRVKGWLLEKLVDDFELDVKPDLTLTLMWMEAACYANGVPKELKQGGLALGEQALVKGLYYVLETLAVGKSMQGTGATWYDQILEAAEKAAAKGECEMRGFPERASDMSRRLRGMPRVLEDVLGLKFTVKITNKASEWTFTRVKPSEDLGPPPEGLFAVETLWEPPQGGASGASGTSGASGATSSETSQNPPSE